MRDLSLPYRSRSLPPGIARGRGPAVCRICICRALCCARNSSWGASRLESGSSRNWCSASSSSSSLLLLFGLMLCWRLILVFHELGCESANWRARASAASRVGLLAQMDSAHRTAACSLCGLVMTPKCSSLMSPNASALQTAEALIPRLICERREPSGRQRVICLI